MTVSLSRARKYSKTSLALFAASLALALSATALADERCGPDLQWDGRQCVILVRGVLQRPQVFTLTGRRAHDWTAADQAPRDQRSSVVNATRRNPF